jgi:sialic acid synthase SpsE
MAMAEIGCNHMGSMDAAKELLDIAKEAGADYTPNSKSAITARS